VQNAVDQARSVAACIAGEPQPYTSVPWFWSDQHGTKLQIAGLTAGREAAVVRGDVDAASFSVYCFTGDRLVGVESVNQPREHLAARRLLEAGGGVTPADVAAPGFALAERAAQAVEAAGG
jgi:3-phenylpropionate/trans-cinnamate dioxygenase ferredoxin reductase subunit